MASMPSSPTSPKHSTTHFSEDSRYDPGQKRNYITINFSDGNEVLYFRPYRPPSISTITQYSYPPLPTTLPVGPGPGPGPGVDPGGGGRRGRQRGRPASMSASHSSTHDGSIPASPSNPRSRPHSTPRQTKAKLTRQDSVRTDEESETHNNTHKEWAQGGDPKIRRSRGTQRRPLVTHSDNTGRKTPPPSSGWNNGRPFWDRPRHDTPPSESSTGTSDSRNGRYQYQVTRFDETRRYSIEAVIGRDSPSVGPWPQGRHGGRGQQHDETIRLEVRAMRAGRGREAAPPPQICGPGVYGGIVGTRFGNAYDRDAYGPRGTYEVVVVCRGDESGNRNENVLRNWRRYLRFSFCMFSSERYDPAEQERPRPRSCNRRSRR